jgi:hypothetical protein
MAAYDAVDTEPADDEESGAADVAPKATEGDVKRYWREIERYEKAAKEWYSCGDKIVKRYADEDHPDAGERRFALLWANVETYKPSIYSKAPICLVERRYRDKDPIGRVAADIMERVANATLDIGGIDETLRLARDDVLLPGRGTVWVRYAPTFEKKQSQVIDFKTGKQTNEEYEALKSERLCVDYVYWKFFGHNLARCWSNVWVCWRICHYEKAEATQHFGKAIADKLKYTTRRVNDDDDESEANCAEIYEVWDSRKRLMSCIVKEWDDKGALDSGPPPINFSRFFPCPEPAYATRTTKSLFPTPDYEYYRDQAKDIDDLTAKISNMLDWLRVKAFIPRGPSGGGADAIEAAVTDSGNDDIFIEVGSWAEWVEKGGAKALIDWLPIDMIVKALQQAIAVRNQIVQDVYQITGISDILRGQTDPEETFGAQDIKQQTGGRRLRNRKDDFARFCEDVCRLVVEAGAENFQPQTLAEMSGYLYTPGRPTVQGNPQPPSPPLAQLAALQAPGGVPTAPPGATPMPGMGHNGGPAFPSLSPPNAPGMPPVPAPEGGPTSFGDDVVELLRNDRMRTFRIKVETDSTTQPDDDREKQRRVEFLNTVAAYLEKASTAIQMAPDLAPAIKEFLMFAARGFRVGRNLESVIEDAIDKLASDARQPKPDKIDAVSKAKMEQSAQEHQEKMQQADKQFQQTMVQNDQTHQQKLQQADRQFAQQMAFEREKGAKEIAVEEVRRKHDRADAMMNEANARRAAIEDRNAAQAQQSENADNGAAVKHVKETSAQMANVLQGITGGLDTLAKQVAGIMDEMGAPIELIKKNGRIAGGKRGSRTIMIS